MPVDSLSCDLSGMVKQRFAPLQRSEVPTHRCKRKVACLDLRELQDLTLHLADHEFGAFDEVVSPERASLP